VLLSEITKFIQKLAPAIVNKEDNASGLQYGSRLPDRNMRNVVITITPTLTALNYAIKKKSSLIITYFPLIEGKLLHLNYPDHYRKRILGKIKKNNDNFIKYDQKNQKNQGKYLKSSL